MSPKLRDHKVINRWTNGRKAVVYLLDRGDGSCFILKHYKARFMGTMFREWSSTKYLATRVSQTPRLLGASFLRRSLEISYFEGERVLEWVLARFGPKDLDLKEFASFHGLYTNPTVLDAFEKFRNSSDPEAVKLRSAIQKSYATLHRAGWIHGSADPRNLIYDGEHAYIIDLDHARPAISGKKNENSSLKRWFGVEASG
jgi:serine/threonine-protein kinase RIO1